jgi:hypothetical protein
MKDMIDFEIALCLLRNWVAGNGDEHFVSKEVCRELLEASAEFLKKYPQSLEKVE